MVVGQIRRAERQLIVHNFASLNNQRQIDYYSEGGLNAVLCGLPAKYSCRYEGVGAGPGQAEGATKTCLGRANFLGKIYQGLSIKVQAAVLFVV
jgi:hypothetical protein